MVPVRVQLPEEVVEAERGGADRAKGLVAARVDEGSAPKVVGKEGGPRCSGAEVIVGQYCSPENRRDDGTVQNACSWSLPRRVNMCTANVNEYHATPQ